MNSTVWEEYSRQPFMAVWQILFKSTSQILKAFWPILFVMFLRSEGEKDTIGRISLILFPLIAFATAFVSYLFFRFRVTDDEIQVKSGIFSRKHITLPLHKIQAVHINQNWMQKALNISELVFDTPGSGEAEIKLQLETHKARELMSYVLVKSDETESIQNKEQLISELSFTEVLKLGVSSNHFETLLILIGVFLSFLNNIKEIIDDYQEDILESSTIWILESSILIIVVGIFAILLLSVVVSLFRNLLAYFNFRITKTENGFRINKGLVNNSQKLFPFEKIQFVSWKTNWLRKKFSLYLFEFHTIGGNEIKSNLKIKVPVTSERILQNLAGSYFLDIPEKFVSSLKVDRSYVYRNTLLYGILPSFILAIPLLYFVNEKAFLLLFAPLYVFLNSWLYQRKFLFSWTSNIIHIKSGVFGIRTILLKWEKIQSVKISQSLFQQRKLLADLTFHTAGGAVTAHYIPLNVARELQNFALYKLES